jgi:hypothetical protein
MKLYLRLFDGSEGWSWSRMWVVIDDDETDGYVMVLVLPVMVWVKVLVKVVDEYSVDVLYVPQTLAGQIWKSLEECMEAFGVSV